jgi:hypothetical protein
MMNACNWKRFILPIPEWFYSPESQVGYECSMPVEIT